MTSTFFHRHIHMLYVPTLACNLGCRYCYLGGQTGSQSLKEDAARAAETLRTALDSFLAAGVLPFNVSLHGGEPTMLPENVLDELFTIIRRHYQDNFDALNALGFRKSAPHIKTNLFNFHKIYSLLDHHRVSVSASIDLPLSLHEAYRTTRQGESWLQQTLHNLRLLASYPHAKKISSTLYREHLENVPALIRDIWYIHRDIRFDMNNFNFMFGFDSALNREKEGYAAGMASDEEQAHFYQLMQDEFMGTELEDGLRRNWFEEFKPTYCTNAFNCGERFYLVQSDGEVYSCVRGQGIEECRYGNILDDPVKDILAAGGNKIALLHQQAGLHQDCRACDYLRICHTGCPVVKLQTSHAKSYTCALQKAIYRDNPRSCPAAETSEQRHSFLREYVAGMHPALAFEEKLPDGYRCMVLPNDLYQDKNGLSELIAADPVLQELYSDSAVIMEVNGEMFPLRSQILKNEREFFSLCAEDSVFLHIKPSLFEAGCGEIIRNTLYLQMLRDTSVVYGDERRSKQEHLFTHQIFFDHLQQSSLFDHYLLVDLTSLLKLHSRSYLKSVLNNLFVTTSDLRDYHYQKQKNNAFYHIQALNLPFQNFEFYWDEPEEASDAD